MDSADIKLFEEIYLMSKKEISGKYKLLGEGGGRLIYGLDDRYVIKLSKSDGGDEQCEQEYYIYNDIEENLKRYLCPVIWYKDDMLIMRKAIPLAKNRKEKSKNVFKFLNVGINDTLYLNTMKLIEAYDLLYGDIKSLSSWGMIDNQIVLIDYGCTNEIYDKYFSSEPKTSSQSKNKN